MTYLDCVFIIAIATGFFVYVMAQFERRRWPSDNASTLEDVLRELIGSQR